MKKTIFALTLAALVVAAGAYYFLNNRAANLTGEEIVLEETLAISKEYLALRLRTDDVLVNAKYYPDYESWNAEMTRIIDGWEELAEQSEQLEKAALEIADQSTVGFRIIEKAHAYSAKEISDIYDKAPKFKGIATLAKHLGVDAKRAQIILDQAQGEISSGVFSEEGDSFQKLENTAIVVKDGCKVAGFVGGVVLTGGAAGFAAAGVVTKTAVVVAGADLALEITEDSAQIAFGDKNKVSSIVKDIRTVTEPVATVLTITNIPANLGSTFGKIDAVMIGLEQFREAAQEGKVVGIDLKNFESHPSFQVIKNTKYPGTATVAEMEMAEVEEWLKSINKKQEPMTPEEIKKFLSVTTVSTAPKEQIVEEKETPEAEQAQQEEGQTPETTTAGPVRGQTMAGTYSGSATLQHIEEDVESPDSLPVTLQLNEGGTGTVNVNGFDGEAFYAGNKVEFNVTMKEGGAVINCSFEGKATSNGSQTTISGNMHFSMMGVTFATYSWSAQK